MQEVGKEGPHAFLTAQGTLRVPKNQQVPPWVDLCSLLKGLLGSQPPGTQNVTLFGNRNEVIRWIQPKFSKRHWTQIHEGKMVPLDADFIAKQGGPGWSRAWGE